MSGELSAVELDAMGPGAEVIDRDGTAWVRERSTRLWKYEHMTRGWSSEMLFKKWGPLRRRESHVEQPLPTASTGPSMHVLAVQEVTARMDIGLARYGQPLQAMNGRDAVRDTIEELADGLAYALQIREERRLLRAELTALLVTLTEDGVGAARTLDVIIDRYFPEG